MLDALAKLGACQFEWIAGGSKLVIKGNGGRLNIPSSEIYLGNAGTASRFLTTVCNYVKYACGAADSDALFQRDSGSDSMPAAPA